MKKAICAILVAALAAGALGTFAAPAAADSTEQNRGERFRHNSPLFGPIVLYPVSLVGFIMDVPIYLMTRHQPFTDGLTDMKLIDGYNPMTSTWSKEAKHPSHEIDATGGGY